MISYKKFSSDVVDGTLTRFLSDFIISTEQHVRVYNYIYDPINGDDVLDIADPTTGLFLRKTDAPSSSDLQGLDKWDLVDNSILFYTAPPTTSSVYFEVATTPEEFGGTLIQPSVERAETAAAAAEASEIAAKASEDAAAISETNASNSETNAATSASNASTSETNAAASASAASTSASNAATSETNASTSETNAATSASNASTSETNAAASEAAALVSETNAAASALSADTDADRAEAALQTHSTTSARNSVISAVNGVNALATTPTPSHKDIAYTGNGTSLNLKTGEADGVEQIVNGGGSDTTGWTTVTSTLTTDGSVFTLTIAGSAGGMKQTLSGLTIGGQYDVEFTVDSVSDASGLHIGTTDNGFDVVNQAVVVGKNRVTIHPTTSTIYFKIVEQNASDAVTMVLHDITTKEVTGGLPSVSRPWVASASYTLLDETGKDTLVTHDYVIYKAKTAHSGVATTPDLDTTNWEAQADGISFDADNADLHLKGRNVATRWNIRYDSLRGVENALSTNETNSELIRLGGVTSFNTDGFSVGNGGYENQSGTTYVAWCEYFDKMFSFTTNHGKRGICAYNAQSGKFMVSYQGSGTAGHEIPHGVGTKPDFFVAKDRDAIQNWIAYNSISGAEKYLVLNGSSAIQDDVITWNDTEPTSTNFTVGIYNDTLNHNYIAYGSSNRKNHSYVGRYVGTGVAGNPVDVGMDLLALSTAGKKIKIMFKKLSGTGSWGLKDGARGTDVVLWADLSNAETTAYPITFTNNGYTIDASTDNYNLAGATFLAEVTIEDFDNPNGGLDLNPSKTSFADGSNATGDADLTATTIAPATYPQIAGAKNYFYTDFVDADTVTLGSTDVKLLEGLNRVDADKWGVVSPSDTTLKTTDKHSGYVSATGVVSGAGGDSSGFEYWRAFNKAVDDQWASVDLNVGELIYQSSEPRILKGYVLTSGANTTLFDDRFPKDFTIEGSDDGVTWIVIDTQVSYPTPTAINQKQSYETVANSTPYKYLKIDITAVGTLGNTINIGELELNTEHPSGDFYNVAEGVMYNSADTAIKRVYTGEADVDGSGEIISDTWVDRAVKNQNFTDVTVHGDAEFLGGFDLGQSWVDENANRYSGVTYTNSTGKQILVNITGTAGSTDFKIYIDNTLVAQTNHEAGVIGFISAIVPPLATYRVDAVGAITIWAELK